MMKLAVLLATLISANAMATPKVGDYAKFDAVAQKDGQSMGLTIELAITNYNQSNNQYLQKQVITISGGQSQVSEDWKPADDFLSDATINAVLNNCAQAGGTLQTVQSPAGLFNACAVPFDNQEERGTAWITAVPFGIVKMESYSKTEGLTITSVLSSYR
ncbi:MAG: hypothetical protein M9962_02755 [Oligoflexia bacterium]|nr:hypothetical protein [Oligoflexia bacterium]